MENQQDLEKKIGEGGDLSGIDRRRRTRKVFRIRISRISDRKQWAEERQAHSLPQSAGNLNQRV